jgi:MFS family permease
VCTTSSTIELTAGRTIVRRTDTDITIEPGARDVEIPWSFFRKAALVLFGISLLASLASTTLFMGYRLPVEAWRIVFILALVTLTITRTILIPGVLLPNVTSPHLEFLADDLQDEWRELQQRTISHPHILIVSASISALVYVWCIFYHGILTNAMWFGWMPVGVAAIGMDLLLFAFARRTDWYNNRFYRTPTWIMLTAFAGFAAALFLGIHLTEQAPPTRSGQLPTAEQNVDYGYVGSRAYYITRQYLNFGPTPEITVPDCDDDACAYVILAIVFVLLTTTVGGRSGIDSPRMGAQHSGAADAHRVVRAPRHPT